MNTSVKLSPLRWTMRTLAVAVLMTAFVAVASAPARAVPVPPPPPGNTIATVQFSPPVCALVVVLYRCTSQITTTGRMSNWQSAYSNGKLNMSFTLKQNGSTVKTSSASCTGTVSCTKPGPSHEAVWTQLGRDGEGPEMCLTVVGSVNYYIDTNGAATQKVSSEDSDCATPNTWGWA